MLVKEWMSTNVITIDAQDSMYDATGLMLAHPIRRLPVTHRNTLVGIVTDRDLKRSSASDATSLEIHELLYILAKIKVSEIMTKDPITVPPDFTVEETAELLLKHKISGVPVVDESGRLQGIITQTDLFRVLISLTGVGVRGIQFAMMIKDQPGTIKDVEDIIRVYGGRMVSILTSYDRVPEGYRRLFIRMHSIERGKLEELEQDLVQKAKVLYIVDQRENRRRIYQ